MVATEPTLWEQGSFDGRVSQLRKLQGIQAAAEARKAKLELARAVAVHLAAKHGTVDADDVSRYLEDQLGIEPLGPEAGALFAGEQFTCTGQFRPSTRKTNHGRLLRVWALSQG